jgi:formate dehydrogenase major subunit
VLAGLGQVAVRSGWITVGNAYMFRDPKAWEAASMGVRSWIQRWPALRQISDGDPLGRGRAAQSARSASLTPRTATADRVAHSVCPYCAVGCAQKVYVKDDEVIQIEGDPDSPISRGRLCPKGSATKQLVTGPHREQKVLYRAPFATEWRELDLEAAMDMVADRVLDARHKGWQDVDDKGQILRRTLGIASLGGATLDNEENYLIKKLFTALGAIQIENQARI